MRRIPGEMLERMAGLVSGDDRDEMAIPSYLHPNPMMRWMAWRRVEEIAALISRTLPHHDGAHDVTVMDFGCGTGVLFEEILARASSVIGVDLVLEPAQLLLDEWQLEGIRLLSPQEAKSEVPAGGLDAIIAAEVLEHIEPIGPTIEFFRSRLKPEGKLFISVPTENALYRLGRRMAGFHGHYHESNASLIHRRILESGFRETAISKIPAPGPLAIYWVVAYEPS